MPAAKRELDPEHWERRLTELVDAHPAPGAALAIRSRDESLEVAAGVAKTRVDVTPQTIFQIGSVTKPYTATLIMQLVDERRLDLDQHVVELLPELKFEDPTAGAAIPVRHLLSHTSGIDGDRISTRVGVMTRSSATSRTPQRSG